MSNVISKYLEIPPFTATLAGEGHKGYAAIPESDYIAGKYTIAPEQRPAQGYVWKLLSIYVPATAFIESTGTAATLVKTTTRIQAIARLRMNGRPVWIDSESPEMVPNIHVGEHEEKAKVWQANFVFAANFQNPIYMLPTDTLTFTIAGTASAEVAEAEGARGEPANIIPWIVSVPYIKTGAFTWEGTGSTGSIAYAAESEEEAQQA